MSAKEGDFEKKRSPQEKTYYLSKIVEDGGCIHCLNNSCRNRSNHGIEFPEKLTCFVKNPRFIKEVATSIESATSNGTLNFDDIPFNVTTCTFIHTGNCKNCNEGRYRTFDMNGSEIGVCFPSFDETKTKIIIGVHMDIKIIMRGKHYEVSALPILHRENFELGNRRSERIPGACERLQHVSREQVLPHDSMIDENDFSNILNIYENSTKQKRNGNFRSSSEYYGAPISRINSSESTMSAHTSKPMRAYSYAESLDEGMTKERMIPHMTQELSLASMDEFPSLGNTPCPSPLVVIENIPTKKNFADIIKSVGNEEKEKKILSLETSIPSRSITPRSITPRSTTPRFTPISDDKREVTISPLPERSFTPIASDDFENQHIILKTQLEVMKKENSRLIEENQVLKITNTRNMYVIENQLKIGEFLKNRNLLNNTVIEQFFNTHYSDYIVLN